MPAALFGGTGVAVAERYVASWAVTANETMAAEDVVIRAEVKDAVMMTSVGRQHSCLVT